MSIATKKRAPKRKRVYRTGLGVIFPHARYTKEGVRNAVGLGTAALRQAVASGIVTPLNKCGRNFYKGRELIRWIDS